ncbi:hypothetical protein HBH70_230460 [Parastagonospora nodorum]|nr:hypothetical protein HBH53_237970 [Parastagonospora nodorum]KAH4061535.1 hypothetical protein HBH50_222140 [Parastagonospora nodorum]KAH4079981.1 hypothetical protein HBH48_215630 [Parastagonospora nodorum]KAH4404140.1 hypothetical protein HBH92_194900 [Parastagonospora nodorum]KAH4420678.1 hypothetical protein HBH93_203110 [Parastagonospora nodorum]
MSSPFTQQTPTGLLIATTIGITGSAWICGSNASLSLIAVPAIMQAPAPLAAKQWYTVLMRGGSFGIPFALGSALVTAYVASQHARDSLAFKLNVAATILLPSIVPFTIAFIAPINDKLIEKMNSMASASLDDEAVEQGVAEGETTHALIDKWATLNLARAVFLAAGALCTTIAALDKREVVGFSNIGLRSGANRM